MNGTSGFKEVQSFISLHHRLAFCKSTTFFLNRLLAHSTRSQSHSFLHKYQHEGQSVPRPLPNPVGMASLIFFVIALLFTGCDRIYFRNAETNTITAASTGVLIDGVLEGVYRNDYVYVKRDARRDIGAISIGNFTEPQTEDEPGEVIAFTTGRPPTILNFRWSNFIDLPVVTFQPPYAISVYVWIVAGDNTAQRTNAVLASIETERIWMEERQGIKFSSFNISDQFMDPALRSFSCTHENVAAIKQTTDRYKENAINIYYVEEVELNGRYSPGNGVHCGDALDSSYNNIIVMGKETQPALLAHEIGHSFDLIHIGYSSEFGKTNVMHESSNVRRYLTEGQTFRQVTNSGSLIHSIYKSELEGAGLRLPQPRNCLPILGHAEDEEGWFGEQNTVDAQNAYKKHLRECPILQKRIWMDLELLEALPVELTF